MEESSDSDHDDSLQDDINALSEACMPPDTLDTAAAYVSDDDNDNDDDLAFVRSVKEKYGTNSAAGGGGGCFFDEDDDDGDYDIDDLELIRSIKEKYGEAVNVQPILAIHPDSDDEDDFETVRAIKRRFSQFVDAADGCGGGASGGSSSRARDAVGATESNSGGCVDSFLNDVIGLSLGNEPFDLHGDNAEQDVHNSAPHNEGASTSGSSFPTVAQTFMEAIKKNRSCQKFMRCKMLHIEARMEEVKDLQKRLKTLRDFQVRCKKKVGRALSQKLDARIQLISAAKQRAKGTEKHVSAMSYGPPENSHVAIYKSALAKFPLSFQREKWSLEDRQNLEKGLIQKYQEMLLLRESADVQSFWEEPGSANGVDGMILSIRNHDITPQIMKQFAGKVNWEQLASMYLPRRNAAECEARWLNYENRLINRNNWTPEEDKRLLFILQERGIYNWSRIAEELGTNRTPFQCLARYQRSLNAKILKSDWTEDEDVQLRSAVESFGESNWQAVASVLEGRTGTQCSNRWKKTLHPARERVGKWGYDEDKRLRVAVTLFGKSWHRIAQFVPGRTQVQCRERWVNILDPNLNRGGWTQEDDSKLKEAIVEHGYCWSKIAACLPLRTDNQCRRRWKRLFPQDVPLLKEKRNIQRKALISNFVDRESERPALGPKDFVPLPIEGSRNEQENGNQQKQKKSSSNLKKVKSRECARSSISPDTRMITACDATGKNDRDGVSGKKRMISKSGSKIGKFSAKAKKNSSVSLTSEQTRETENCSSLKEVKLKKRRRSATSSDSKMIHDCVAERKKDGDEGSECKKRRIGKFGSKKKKYSGTKAKKRSYERTESDKTCEKKESDETSETDSWDVPIGISLRRLQGVKSKGNPSNGYSVIQASGIHNADVETSTRICCLEQENGSKDWFDPSSCPDSELEISAAPEVEVSDLHAMARRRSCSKVFPERSETTLGNTSSDGNPSHGVDVADSSKMNAHKHRESNLYIDHFEESEDLPLSALFSEVFTRIRRN